MHDCNRLKDFLFYFFKYIFEVSQLNCIFEFDIQFVERNKFYDE